MPDRARSRSPGSRCRRYSEPALHALGAWGPIVGDLSVGREFGAAADERVSEDYAGVRLSARAGLTLLSSRSSDHRIDPLNVSLGAGVIGWLSCCSPSGPGSGPEPVRGPAPTVWIAERLWLWEPLGLDLRYEIPLLGEGFLNTVSLGVVLATD